jgi:hypothetical protein
MGAWSIPIQLRHLNQLINPSTQHVAPSRIVILSKRSAPKDLCPISDRHLEQAQRAERPPQGSWFRLIEILPKHDHAKTSHQNKKTEQASTDCKG